MTSRQRKRPTPRPRSPKPHRDPPPFFPHVEKAHTYARDVVEGRILACRWVRLACERHLNDLDRSKTPAFAYTFDARKASRICVFAELLPHVKGEWALPDPATGRAHRIRLEPWQCFILCSIFGWVKKSNGMRRFRKASIYVPRKNAKSTLAAIIGWWMFAKDDEPGAEVYCGATSKNQAGEVFKPAQQMGRMEPKLLSAVGAVINASTMIRPDANARFEPIIARPRDGASPHLGIIDEYHEHKTSALYYSILTGMAARRQPLQLVISTAGDNLAGPCREDWKTCENLLAGESVAHDDTHFAIIYTIDKDDEWDSEDSLRKANPNFDVSVSRDFLLAELHVARTDARKQAHFKTKHLNLWVAAKNNYFNVEQWRACKCAADTPIALEDLAGQPCYLAADFASKHDLTALIYLFPHRPDGRHLVFGKYYISRGTADLPENEHYRAWERRGLLHVCDGAVTDMDDIINDAVDACSRFDVREMPFDPARAHGIFPRLQSLGVPVVEYRNVVLSMSDPMKQLDAWIKAKLIVHDGDPILEWAISNVVAKEDKKGNVFPDKDDPKKKIDPVTALISAIGRAVHMQSSQSVYATRGLVTT